jgi:RNA polymerase sigma-70 factor, ECF subfamily
MHDDDRAIVRAIREGDEGAFVPFVHRLHGRLVAIAGRIVAPEMAEDIAQQTWEVVIRGADHFDGRSRLETWIVQIALNRARTARRDDRRYDAPTFDDLLSSRFNAVGAWRGPLPRWAIDEHASPEALAAGRELVATLGRALNDLPEVQRLVVTMRDIEGFDAEVVCEVLELTEANQRVLLHRARTRLRLALEDVMAEAPAAGCAPVGAVTRPPETLTRNVAGSDE